jgi:ribosomal protein S3
LQKIAAGQLDEASKQEAKLLEAQLRDGIRGRELIDSKLQEAIRAARLRGIEVVVLDEGGLSSLAENSKVEIRQRFAAELDQISSGRVTIRAPRGGKTHATFVASRPGTAIPDVFLKL